MKKRLEINELINIRGAYNKCVQTRSARQVCRSKNYMSLGIATLNIKSNNWVWIAWLCNVVTGKSIKDVAEGTCL